MFRLTLIALSCALTGAAALADDLPEPRMMTLTNGVICDTVEQVEVLLAEISINNGQFPKHQVEGCGQLRGPMPAIVTPTHWYLTPIANSLIAEFKAPNGWTQYGWIDYEPNPEFIPASQDPDA